jgi:hypothetical protein
MCCENFWKRLVSFLLAFWLGVLISGLFPPDNSSFEESANESFFEEKNISEKENQKLNLPSEKKNCVPTDGRFKYNYLSGSGNQTEIIEKFFALNKKKLEIIEKETKSKSRQDKEVLQEMIEEIEKQMNSILSNNQHNLLYLEKCFDSNGRKPSPKTHN